jgi:hypothetical protein
MHNVVKQKKNKSEKNLIGWDRAVYDTETRLAEAQCRVIELASALRHFKKMRESGETWPGNLPTPGSDRIATQN